MVEVEVLLLREGEVKVSHYSVLFVVDQDIPLIHDIEAWFPT